MPALIEAHAVSKRFRQHRRFSGYIPLWFFPDAVAGVIRFLPVTWVGFHPIAVYLGKTSVTETWLFLGLGIGWALLLSAGVGALWHRAALRITVQGG